MFAVDAGLAFARELEALRMRAHCERVVDLCCGLAALFGAVGGLIFTMGLWISEPFLTASAGLVWAPAAAIGMIGRTLCDPARIDGGEL